MLSLDLASGIYRIMASIVYLVSRRHDGISALLPLNPSAWALGRGACVLRVLALEDIEQRRPDGRVSLRVVTH